MKVFLYVLAIAFALISCNGKEQKTDSRIVTVSIEPLRYAVEQIAGKQFQVETLVPNGSSPETYEPSPQQLVLLGQSAAYFNTGYLGFEQTWNERLQESAPHVLFINTSEGIKLLKDDAHASHSHGHCNTQGIDPHVWASAKNMKIIATNIYNTLCLLDSTNQELYKSRYERFIAQVNEVDDSITYWLSDSKQREFLIYHPTLSYFALDYGLIQHAVEEQGKEPSPSKIKRLIEQCRRKQIKTIFVQKEFDIRHAQLIAKETGTEISTINPLDYNWPKEMLNIAQTLKNE